MRLHSPAFEKSLRRKVKQAVRASPALRREARTLRRPRNASSLAPVLRPGLSLALAIGAWQVGVHTAHPATALAVIVLWALFLALFHAQRLLSYLYTDGDVTALSIFPLTGSTIFKWEFQKFYRRTLMALVDFVCGFGALALWLEFSPLKWLALIPIVILTWLVVVALAMLLAAHFPAFPYSIATALMAIVAIGVLVTRKAIGPIFLAALDRAAPYLNVILPTGWPVSLFQLLMADAPPLYLALSLPAVAIVATILISFARLQSTYEFVEVIVTEAPDLVPSTTDTSTPPDFPPFHLGLTAIEDIIRSREFFVDSEWRNRGWLDELLWRWFTTRERVLAEFVFPGGFNVTGSWKRIARHALIAALIAFAAAFFMPLAKYWILAAGLLTIGLHVLTRLFHTGRAFQQVLCSGVHIAMYAPFPIGYREVNRLLMKCAATQAPLVFAVALATGVLTALFAKWSWQAGIVFGCKLAVLTFAARLLCMAFSFSSRTNDTSRFRLSVLALVVIGIICCVSFVAVAATSLFLPNQLLAWSLCAAALLEAYAFLRIYGWFYDRMRFDLMTFPRTA